ncbi:MAG: UpxY family transcription antiterminator [Bacteroidaceae bacterium]|jgi:transcription antitermination factor NusG
MDNGSIHWFALKTFYNKLFYVKKELDEAGWKTYVAMTQVEKFNKSGKLEYVEKPLIGQIMFVQCSRSYLVDFKDKHEKDMMFYRDLSTGLPAPIDDVEMRSFIILTSAPGRRIELLDMDMPTYRKGQRVKVINGIYKGAEGYIKKIKSDRKLLVALNGVAVVAVSYIPSAYLESLEEECDIYNFQNRV